MNTAERLPIARRTQAERTALSDARMLDAAVRLIVERGAAGTTLKDVGERAGYSRGLAGARFGTKAALFSFIVTAVGEEWRATLREAVANRVGLEAICAATDAHYRHIRNGADRIRAFYCLWFDSIGPDVELKRVIANVHERRQRDVETWIRRGIEAGTLAADVAVAAVARQFCATIIGIVYQWLVTPDAHALIAELHDDLKRQMTRALARTTTGAIACTRG